MQAQANWENQLLALTGNIPHLRTRPFFSCWAGDVSLQLQSTYKNAEKVAADHSKSFHFASELLPEEKRSAARALYAFCRTVVDVVDESTDDQHESQLDYWCGMVEHGSFHDDDLVAAAWADTITRYHIPRHYALQWINGVHRDLHEDSWSGVKLLEREGQLASGAASVLYQSILDNIENHDYNIFIRCANLSALGKVRKIPALW